MGVQRVRESALSALQVLRRNKKGTLQVIPFRSSHIRALLPEPTDHDLIMAVRAEQTGPAWTICYYGMPIASAGCSVQKPGVGEVWTMLTPLAKRYPLFLHRAVKGYLEAVLAELDEVWAACKVGDHQWLERLGMFHVERAEMPELYQRLGPDKMLFVRRK